MEPLNLFRDSFNTPVGKFSVELVSTSSHRGIRVRRKIGSKKIVDVCVPGFGLGAWG